MSTRAMIARPQGDGFVGRYHHSDGYPSGLGATLYEMANNGPFKGNLSRMFNVLLDQHPAGWSTINGADWSQEPGFINVPDFSKPMRPRCYCHGDRNEKADEYNNETKDHWLQYAYVIDADSALMTIFSWGDNNWIFLDQIDLWADEPDWEAIQKRA